MASIAVIERMLGDYKTDRLRRKLYLKECLKSLATWVYESDEIVMEAVNGYIEASYYIDKTYGIVRELKKLIKTLRVTKEGKKGRYMSPDKLRLLKEV